MREDIRQLLGELDLGSGASAEDVAAAEQALGIRFPSDYADVALAYDGGVGTLGSSYLQLYSLETLLAVNREWRVTESGDIVPFGSDGGGEAYAFSFQQEPMTIIQLPIICWEPEDVIVCGKTFAEFLSWVSGVQS